MTEPESYGPLMLLMGLTVLLSVPLRQGLRRFGLPGLLGFIALGIGLSALNGAGGVLTPFLKHQVELLAQIGIIALLFRVGLESDPARLAGQLGRAAMIWLPNMAVPGLLAFLLIWAWPGLGLVPALLTGIAASATSIGVSVAPWEEAGRLSGDDGALMLDVAELDDLSAVILLGVVFAVAPTLEGGLNGVGWGDVAGVAGLQLLKILAFSALCYGFSRVLERPFSTLFAGLDPRIGPFVFATGTVFLIAALADGLGFSMAIGALFAGLAFSRDPAERRIDEAFAYVLALFGPFFFISIGLSLGFEGLGGTLGLAVALFVVLSLGKYLGAGLAARSLAGPRTGRLIGASMIPRAEIYLIVMMQGLQLGPWAVPQQLYAAAVLASVGTCILGPLAVSRLIRQDEREQAA